MTEQSGEQKSSETKELDLFLEWQKIYEERISRLLILAVGISLFYFYFVFLIPYKNKERIAELKSLKHDLSILTNDCIALQSTYENFASPKESFPHPFINNTLVPFLENSVKKNESLSSANKELSTRIKSEQEQIDNLKGNIKELTKLYTERQDKFSHLQTSVSVLQSNSQIEAFREALGTLFKLKNSASLPDSESPEIDDNIKEINRKSHDNEALSKLRTLLINGEETIKISDDPANNLKNIVSLEKVIRDLKDFERSEANLSLASKARSEIFKESATNPVHIGDSITQTISYDKYFGKYTSQDYKSKLNFVKNKELSSYNEIVLAVQPPFEVETVSDLIKLQDYSGSLLSKTISENQNTVLTLPIVNINIDRSTVVLGLPIFILFLIYTVRVYSERMTSLIHRIAEDKNYQVTTKDFLTNSPLHLFLYISSFMDLINISQLSREKVWTKIKRDFIGLFFCIILIFPFLIGLACIFYNAPNQSIEFLVSKFVVGIIFIILAYIEIYYIGTNIRSLNLMIEDH